MALLREAAFAQGAAAIPVPLPVRAKPVADVAPAPLTFATLQDDLVEAEAAAGPADGPEVGRVGPLKHLRAVESL